VRFRPRLQTYETLRLKSHASGGRVGRREGWLLGAFTTVRSPHCYVFVHTTIVVREAIRH